MQSAISVKAGVAFLAGVLVALGGAIVYFQASDAHATHGIQVTAVNEPAPPIADISAPVPQPAQPMPALPTSESTAKPTKQNIAAAPAKPANPKPKTTRRPVSLAVWHSKSPPIEEASVQNLPAAPVPAIPPDVTIPPPPAQPVVAPPQPHTVTIPAGATVAIRLTEKLSSEHNFSGDTFRATLDAPIVMEGFVIADRGAKVLGKIVKAQKPGKFQGMAELDLTLTQISTTDGQLMQVETNDSLRKGPSNANEEVLKMGGGAALGAIIGALAGGGKGAAIGAGAGGVAGTGAVLLGHGRPAVIDNETRLTFTLASPTTLTEKLN